MSTYVYDHQELCSILHACIHSFIELISTKRQVPGPMLGSCTMQDSNTKMRDLEEPYDVCKKGHSLDQELQ